MSKLSGLYYPFSRCINAASLKQMLLVFDEIAFVDPVRDDEWRARLFSNLEQHDKTFHRYQDVHPALADLVEAGCIRRIDPSAGLPTEERAIATLSAVSDLQDETWVGLASKPQKSRLPFLKIRGEPSWQVFRPKLPDDFLDSLTTSPDLERHLIEEGDDLSAWSLSYAAGSAICIGVHLGIAENEGLAPVTDSALHHQLLLMKVARGLGSADRSVPIPDDVVRQLTVDVSYNMLTTVLPEQALDAISFEEIVRFRSNTKDIRSQFLRDIESRLGQLKTIPNAEEWIVAGRKTLADLEDEFRKYQAEFAGARDQVFSGAIKGLKGTVKSGSLVAAVALACIPGPVHILLGSIAASIAFAGSVLDMNGKKKKIQKSAAPSLAYLSRVAHKLH
jgi:hypothetical protein